MKKYQSYLIISTILGGLWLSAIILNSTSYAASFNQYQGASQSKPIAPSLPMPSYSAPSSQLPKVFQSSVNITNTTNSSSSSGNAIVTKNTTGGNAISGNAANNVNVVNSVNSTSDISSNQLKTFNQNINGNQTGNITVNPTINLSQSGTGNNSPPVNVNISNNGTINNDLNLSAKSGNATVSKNTTGGNATTGSAITNANIIDLLNSLVSNGQSFLGTINIYGNLNGNILIPSSLVNQLLSPSQAYSTASNNISVVSSDNINNLVNLIANSGNATVSNNTTGGNATTGNASTNLNIYNLINNQIVGGNILIVLVNVAGTWDGLLLNEPVGTNSIGLGSNIQQNLIPYNISTSDNETINNNLNLISQSGDALVTQNTTAGNATSGIATSDANIVNILGDQINLSGWFGVLFINVFGSWHGSLEIQYPPGNITADNSSSIDNNKVITLNSNTSKRKLIICSIWEYKNVNTSSELQSISKAKTNQSKSKKSLTSFASTVPSNSKISKNSFFGGTVAVIGIVVAGVLIIGERIFAIFIKP